MPQYWGYHCAPYSYFTHPYCGKPEKEGSPLYITSTDEYTIYLVENLSKKVNLSGRNISMDRLFTSISTAKHLLAKKYSNTRDTENKQEGAS